ncbi:MAG: ATP-dependent DNA ligase [Sphingomonas sp.]|nr:ATP-dependent DNA ligase [Sphingomonas sp.]
MEAIKPMEAVLAQDLPKGAGWQYEPKWDGFRCIAVRDGSEVHLWSKSGKPLARYFPDIVAMLGRLRADRFVIDGELLIVAGEAVSFDALQLRLHPAESRVRKLAVATPAALVVFDCLALGGQMLGANALAERRSTLEKMLAREKDAGLILSPATDDRKTALAWLKRGGGALDGVIAKRLHEPYRRGERAMVKVKQRRTADCVVGGFRYGTKHRDVGSLLLGLYNDQGLLDHVGYTSSIAAKDRSGWTAELELLVQPPGFTGNAPGGPSRWATARSAEWQPLRPMLVVEVLYDQVTAGRFRHGTKLLRRRPDKFPNQCTLEQLAPPLTPAQLKQLVDH